MANISQITTPNQEIKVTFLQNHNLKDNRLFEYELTLAFKILV